MSSGIFFYMYCLTFVLCVFNTSYHHSSLVWLCWGSVPVWCRIFAAGLSWWERVGRFLNRSQTWPLYYRAQHWEWKNSLISLFSGQSPGGPKTMKRHLHCLTAAAEVLSTPSNVSFPHMTLWLPPSCLHLINCRQAPKFTEAVQLSPNLEDWYICLHWQRC